MKIQLFYLASLALANPLRVGIDIHLDITENGNEYPAPNLGNQDVPDNLRKLQNSEPIPDLQDSHAADLPTVKLPYEKHKASPELVTNQTFYNFSNIPYAQQPIGDLRFKAAKQLEKNADLPLNDGQTSVICPQAQVGWLPYAKEFLEDFYELNNNLAPKWSYPMSPKDNYTWSAKVPLLKGQDESCLTLDVMVPKRVYDKRNDNDGYDAPVMVWFFGGGFVFGSKTLFGSPSGLFEAALQREDEIYEDFIFVAANYRLGAFGWLAGDAFENAGGYENAGLSDQVAVLEWVQNNIRKFGGNPDQVTVAGESAGASSILHHLVSYGGQKFRRNAPEPKFRRAIVQSPAFFPITSRKAMNETYKTFLAEAGATSFNDLVKAKTEDLIRANAKTIYESPYGRFSYGPVVDDDYVKAPPAIMLKYGFTWHKEMIVSHNRNEGILFTPPWVRDEATLRTFVNQSYPTFDKDSLDELVKTYYVWDQGMTEKAKVNFTSQLFSDFAVRSNVYGLRSTGASWQYLFNFFPGIHGQDANYTFGPMGDPKINIKQRQRFQRYLTSFIKWGNPNYAKLEDDKEFDDFYYENKQMKFGSAILLSAADTVYEMVDDTIDKKRSEYWETAPYWGVEEEILNQFNLQDGTGLPQARLEI